MIFFEGVPIFFEGGRQGGSIFLGGGDGWVQKKHRRGGGYIYIFFKGGRGGGTNERPGTDHVTSGPMRGQEKNCTRWQRATDRLTDMATL